MEKRKFSRITLNMPGKLSIGEDIYSFPTINNLSVGGCSLDIVEVIVAPGTECSLWLPLDSTNPGLGIDVMGVVLRCSGGNLGIRFDSITPESLFHLHNLIRYNSPTPERIDDEIALHPGLK